MTDIQRHRLKNIILYILESFSGGADYIKLYKIMYFANKCQLAKIGLPMVYDNFKAWKHGPVPSFTGAVIKKFENNETLTRDMKPFEGAIRVRRNKLVAGLQKSDRNAIPKFSRDILDFYINKNKYRSWEDISNESHDEAWFEAYHRIGKNYEGQYTIRPHLMAASAHATDYIVASIERLYSRRSDSYNIWSEQTTIDAYEKAAIDICDILALEPDWDGDGAFPVSEDVAENCRKLIEATKSHVELISEIYPTPVGSICIDWNIGSIIVSAEFGEQQMAFYCEDPSGMFSFDSPTMTVSQSAFDSLYDCIRKCVSGC